MLNRFNSIVHRRVIHCVCLTASLASSAALANVSTWNGFSGSSDNWQDSNNWEFNSRPDENAGDSIVQFNFGNRLSPNNDFPAYKQFGQINFLSNAGQFKLYGNTIKLFSGTEAKIENFSGATQEVNFNVGGPGILTESSLSLRPTSGDLIINSDIYADNNNGQINVYGNNGHTLTINGSINQYNTTASLYNRNNNVVVLTNNNSYTGGTTLDGGKLLANNTGGSGTSATGTGTVTVNSGATLGGTGRTQAVTVNGGGTITAGSGSTTSDMIGTLTTATQTWAGGGAYAFNIADTSGSTTTSGQTAGAGSNWDKLAMTTLSVTATSGNKFTIKVIAPAGLTFTNGAKFEIANISGGNSLSTSDLTDLFALDTSAIGLVSGDFSLSSAAAGGSGESGTDLFLSYNGATISSAPEPTSAALVGLSTTALLGMRRGKRRSRA